MYIFRTVRLVLPLLFAGYFFYGGSFTNGFSRVLSGQAFMSDPVSRVDVQCKEKWVATARNDLALQCYLSRDLDRFCLAEERRHLAWLVDQYAAEQEAFNRALLGYTIRVGANYGFASNGEKDPVKAFDNAMRKAAEPLMTPEFKKAIKLKTLRDSEVRGFFELVARKGLIVRDDLNWSVPEYIDEAFKLGSDQKAPQINVCREGA